MRRLALLALALAACGSPPDLPRSSDPATARRGEIKSVERIARYPHWVTRGLIWWSGMSARFPVEHGATLCRLEYSGSTWMFRPSDQRPGAPRSARW